MALREVIESAFADVQYPGDDQIVACDCQECVEIRDYFRGRTWRGHSPKRIAHFRAALSSFFTEEAVHYFLPAFLLAALDSDDAAGIVFEGIHHKLIFPDGHKPRHLEEFVRRIERLTAAQRDALVQFLQHFVSRRWVSESDLETVVEIFTRHETLAA